MFDIGWSEMAIILVVALVVVGPKDLPRLARTLGQWMAKGRSMAREFQRHVDDMAREADLADLKDSVQKISPAGIRDHITKAVDPDGTLGKSLDPKAIAKSFEPTPPKPLAGEAVKATSAPAAVAATGVDPIVAEPARPLEPAETTSGDAATKPLPEHAEKA